MNFSAVVCDYLGRSGHSGSFPTHAVGVVSGEAGTLTQRGIIRLQLKLDGEKIIRVRFKVYGCGFTIASAAWLSERLEGTTLMMARQLHNAQIVEALDLPPAKIHCAVLAEHALQAAIADFDTKQPLVNDSTER